MRILVRFAVLLLHCALAFFRYKTIIGDRLRARHSKAHEPETLIACNILNGMTALGRPASYAIGA